jgi:RNA polymerase sigma factor (sigma-70 family)
MARTDPLANPEEAVRRVYAYAAYRLGDGPEAEDVTSATIERALRYRTSYDAGKGDPAAWLVGIARRTIDEHYRRQALAETVATVPEVAGDPFEDRTIERLAVAAAVGRLDPRERELIALRYGADLTARQIAELLGQRTNTVEVALHRALARLRELVAVPDPEPAVRKLGPEAVEGV